LNDRCIIAFFIFQKTQRVQLTANRES